ncbi:ABC transporter, ATP-binding protein, FtsE/LolD family [Aliarcobacter faecis]|uniref:ABC transporter ATP-binding protein n=1 Tax=Aliarcobacter faecis TaxID=1564138 RepID=UPI00047D42FD|nr:ABC transporter ATP-binding protein [Aliarcobacter faecis]QKF72408.1 ABC transporter, ATP-binding protein, FtsE/LolD family [Aliarcobacter faecis]
MIKIKNLNKIFYENKNKEFYALKNINLEIKKGSCTILKGISGSGKSTLLSIISTIQKPTSGEVFYEDELISKFPDIHSSNFRAKNIGFIFQFFNLFDELSVKENISIPLIPLGFSQKIIDEKVEIAMNRANISNKKDELILNLSGGEKQRCAISRALVNDANLILCDEPTAALDFENSQNFIKIIKELKNLGKTIIIATHDPIFFNQEFVDSQIELKNGIICE